MRLPLSILVAALAVVACSKHETPPPAADTAPAAAAAPDTANDSAAIEAAIHSPERLPGDADEDSWRHPTEVLAFLGVKPGQKVVDYFSAGGYFTELLSRVVGPNGQVIAYNNPAYLKFAGEKPAQRYGNQRLPNVAQLTTPAEEMPLQPNSVDAALFFLSYHDLHWISKKGDWTPTDPAKALTQLVAGLKPGATVVVVDHIANAGSDPAESVDAMHRIDPALVRREFEAAGLVFDGESDLFRNPADDHTKLVFDPAIQHHTDRFMYRFKKPNS
jgi:predicted methyltransferase